MLTPGQIKEYKFQPAGQGVYRADEVDKFFSTVVAAYEKMYRENGDLLKRAGMLAEKVKEYREEEELIKKTLIVAQKKADEIEAAAKKKSEDSVSSALKEAKEKTLYAEKRAKELLTTAEERARMTVSQAEQRATDTLRGASLTAEQTIGSAKGKATLLLTEAKTRADSILADAKKKSDEILGSLKNEVVREKKALETVRAQSKEFKAKLTESYYEQIGMTEQLLSFADSDDGLGEKALEAAQSFEAVREEPAIEQTAAPEIEKLMEDVEAAAEEKAELYVEEEPVTEEPAAEEVSSLEKEPEKEPEFFTAFSEPEEEQEKDNDEDISSGGFAFVGGMFDDYIPEEIDSQAEDIPEVDIADFNDIFSQEINSAPEEPVIEEITEESATEEDRPFGKLNDKYMTFDESEEQNSFFGNVEEAEADDTKIYVSPEKEEKEETPAEEKKSDRKSEKKKRKLSLFSMYEDDEDDEDDDDDEFDDDDDDDTEGGFRVLFRKK